MSFPSVTMVRRRQAPNGWMITLPSDRFSPTLRRASQASSSGKQRSTIGRTVRLDEIAALAVYLASPLADGMNGQTLAIDGGITYG